MIFNSLSFLIFFLLVVGAYFSIPDRFRWALLLAASCYFYMAFVPAYILILFYLIAIDYVMARQIERTPGPRKRIFFLVSIVANIGTLFVFKYFNFFTENVTALAHLLGWNYSIQSLRIILPIGLSFHIFQSLSYIIEVYKGTQKAERHLGIYALYVMFFPQLVAGPIERPQNMLHQFHAEHRFERERFLSGARLMLWGFFKKVVIADRLGGVVDIVYGNLESQPSVMLAIAFVFYAFQIYCDFSGYSDIALGSARILGYDLTLNFNRPFFAASIGDFWKRWHISLSNWFRDYVYFPLAYRAKQVTRTWLYACILVTFLVSGLWHGAGWTFVAWGGLHGAYLVVSQVTKVPRKKLVSLLGLSRAPRLHGLFQRLWVFLLACVSWVFFRAHSFADAGTFFTHLVTKWGREPFAISGLTGTEFALSLALIAILIGVEGLQEWKGASWWESKPLAVRSFAYASALLAIIVFGVFQRRGFIYFQF